MFDVHSRGYMLGYVDGSKRWVRRGAAAVLALLWVALALYYPLERHERVFAVAAACLLLPEIYFMLYGTLILVKWLSAAVTVGALCLFLLGAGGVQVASFCGYNLQPPDKFATSLAAVMVFGLVITIASWWAVEEATN